MDNSGDYISREAAVELLSQPITMSMCLSVEECHHKIAQQCIDRYLVENIHAADVRPVVRGKWNNFFGEAPGITNLVSLPQCSECGFVFNWNSPYCPNCGAKMEES